MKGRVRGWTWGVNGIFTSLWSLNYQGWNTSGTFKMLPCKKRRTTASESPQDTGNPEESDLDLQSAVKSDSDQVKDLGSVTLSWGSCHGRAAGLEVQSLQDAGNELGMDDPSVTCRVPPQDTDIPVLEAVDVAISQGITLPSLESPHALSTHVGKGKPQASGSRRGKKIVLRPGPVAQEDKGYRPVLKEPFSGEPSEEVKEEGGKPQMHSGGEMLSLPSGSQSAKPGAQPRKSSQPEACASPQEKPHRTLALQAEEEMEDGGLFIPMEEQDNEESEKRRKKKKGAKRKREGKGQEEGTLTYDVKLDDMLDRILEDGAKQHNLTAVNVRNILHEVITNEHVVAMMKAAISETEDMPMFPPQFVDIQLEEDDSSDEEYQPDDEEEDETAEEPMDDSLIAFRTRSKMPLKDVPLGQLEAELRAPDITPDMYDPNTADDEDWKAWLGGLMNDDVGNEDEADDDDDPEYNFLEDLDEPDTEDFRTDRAVRITKKEVNELMEELFETFQDEMGFSNMEDDGPEEEERAAESRPNFNTPQALRFEEPLANLLNEQHRTMKELLEQLKMKKSSAKQQQEAERVKPQGEKVDRTLVLDSAQRRRLQHQMQQQVAWILATSKVFMYPELLPVCALKANNPQDKIFFTKAEDNLLALGLKHFEGTKFPKPLISKYLLTCKTAHQLTVRIKNLNMNRARDNIIKPVSAAVAQSPQTIPITTLLVNPTSFPCPLNQPLVASPIPPLIVSGSSVNLPVPSHPEDKAQVNVDLTCPLAEGNIAFQSLEPKLEPQEQSPLSGTIVPKEERSPGPPAADMECQEGLSENSVCGWTVVKTEDGSQALEPLPQGFQESLHPSPGDFKEIVKTELMDAGEDMSGGSPKQDVCDEIKEEHSVELDTASPAEELSSTREGKRQKVLQREEERGGAASTPPVSQEPPGDGDSGRDGSKGSPRSASSSTDPEMVRSSPPGKPEDPSGADGQSVETIAEAGGEKEGPEEEEEEDFDDLTQDEEDEMSSASEESVLSVPELQVRAGQPGVFCVLSNMYCLLLCPLLACCTISSPDIAGV
ncbi:GON-4-like protein [Tupaia chinensis]|uniref:GON-4-like protein n=1 Tax=Tupaia chinensis TaxID=246437 RepID=L9KAW5_TUPCH|nr:GON-4-like protein [Tupaia chinensis]